MEPKRCEDVADDSEETHGQPVLDKDQPSEQGRAVLDGGWGWVCVLSSCFTSILTGGFTASFSIIYLRLIERFGQSAALTAWIYSIYLTFVMMGGPVAAALMKNFGCRRCVMVAGVMYCIGLICTGFAPSLIIIFLSLSVLSGAAGSVPTNSVFVIIDDYFDKNRSKAIGIGLTGHAIGAIVFPVVLQALLEQFGFTGAFLVIGGCFLNLVPLGMLLRSPDENQVSLDSRNEEREQDKVVVDEAKGVNTSLMKDTEGNQLLVMNNPASSSGDSNTPQTQTPKREGSRLTPAVLCAKVVTTLDLSLLKEPVNLAFFCHLIFKAISMSIVACCLAGLAKELGVSKRETAWCLSAFGAASILTRIIAGVVFDLKALRPYRLQLYALDLLLLAANELVVPVIHNLVTLLLFTVFFGIFFSVVNIQEMVILAGLVSKSRYANAVGLATAFKGIGMLLGPPLGGFVRDITGTYVTSYLVAGGCYFVALLIFTTVVYRKVSCRQKQLSNDKTRGENYAQPMDA